MFANIRRHQKWLWILISGAVIISFVWYFNPNSRQGRAARVDTRVGSINGHAISRTEYREAMMEAQLAYFFHSGSWYGTDEFSRQNEGAIERDTRQRLIFKEKLKELNIHVSEEEVANWISENFGRERPFTPEQYDEYVKKVLEPQGIKEKDLERFVRTQVGIMHLASVAGLPGKLVTPQEAEAQFRRENEKAAAEAVIFAATNFLSQVITNEEALGMHYTNQMAVYRIPERVQLSYVEFPASNYFAKADARMATLTNLNLQIDEDYRKSGEKFFTDTNGNALPPDAAKQRIRDNYRTQFALVEAQKDAVDLLEELLKMPGAKQISNLETLATKRGLTPKVTEPFADYETPHGIDAPDRFGETAFALTTAEPYLEQPVRGSEAVYVAGIKNRVPSEVPPLDKVRERVVADYRRIQSQTLMQQAGQAFHNQVTNAMASGKSFTEAAAAAGHPAVNLGEFTQSSPTLPGLDPAIDPSNLKGVAFTLKEGETSAFSRARDRGFVLHVNKFIPADDASVKSALPEYLTKLQRSGISDAFQEWFSKQSQAMRLSLINDKSSGPGQAGDN